VADLACAYESVQCGEHFLDRRQRVEAVQLKEIDVVRAEALEARFDAPDEMPAGRADVIGRLAVAKGRLGGDEHLPAPSLDCLTKHLLRKTIGVNVRRVEHREAGFDADVDESCRLLDAGGAPGLEECVVAPKGACSEGERGDFES
jgi:hypothetical protein